jgi:predicted phage terminase large subunit-like protein
VWGQLLYQGLRRLAPIDVFAYGEYAFRHRPAAHHQEMVTWILERLANHENGVVLEPRGHAKTTWANTILLSWLIAKNRDIRVALVSKTEKQSNAFSRAIKFNFETNEFHREVFGDLVGPAKWTDDEWIQRGSLLHRSNNVTLYSRGALSAIVSKRFDLIICDDILDNENSSTPEQREKMETWFWQTLKPCLAPGGSIIIIGTRWAEDDLYQRLIAPPPDGKGWPSLVRGAITVDPDTGDEIAMWPEVWPIEKLHQERIDMGSAMFACAYLNDISGLMSGNVFRREWFRYVDSLPDGIYRYKMGVDLASSEKERADFTARAVIAEDGDGNTYVLSVVRAKIESGHRQFVIDGANAFPKIDRIVVENNQFQSAFVQELLRTTGLPVVPKRSDVDKTTRARAVSARYESGKVFHLRHLEGSPFEIELLSFPKGHDDQVDALGHAMETGASSLIFGSFARAS